MTIKVTFSQSGTSIVRRVSFVPRLCDEVHLFREINDEGHGLNSVSGTVSRAVVVYTSTDEVTVSVTVKHC